VEATGKKERNKERDYFESFFISCKFTIYSTNGAISKYVVRKHLCGIIIQ
jgi:hypothetical protein